MAPAFSKVLLQTQDSPDGAVRTGCSGDGSTANEPVSTTKPGGWSETLGQGWNQIAQSEVDGGHWSLTGVHNSFIPPLSPLEGDGVGAGVEAQGFLFFPKLTGAAGASKAMGLFEEKFQRMSQFCNETKEHFKKHRSLLARNEGNVRE